MRKSIILVSIIIGIIMMSTGCVDNRGKNAEMPLQTPSLNIQGGGGVVSGDANTEYTFTPDSSGIWLFEMTMDGDGGLSLDIIYPDGSTVTGTGYDSAYLIEGTTYKITTGVWTYSAGRKNSYVLNVSLAEVIPGSGGEIRVGSHIIYSFTPDRTGLWTFQTSNNGDSVPYLNINDLTRGEPGPYNRSGTDDNNAHITVTLDEGITYEVEVGFYLQLTGECTLNVSFADSPGNGGEVLPATEMMRFAIFPTGTSRETYYFVLSHDGVLKCSMGNRTSDDITRLDFLDSVEISAEKQLSEDDFKILTEMAYILDASRYSLEKEYWDDSWVAVMSFNGKTYEIDYWQNDGAEVFITLIETIIDMSPVSVDLHGWS